WDNPTCLTSTAKGDLPNNSSAMTRLDPSKDSVSGKDGISCTPKSLTLEIHHGGCFTPTPSRSYVGGQKGVAIAVDSHLRKAPIEINSSLDVNKNLTPVCHRNLIKEWEQPTSYVEGPIVEEADDPFDGLDEILGGYTNTREEIIGKQMIVHVGNSSTVENVLDYDMLFETEGMIVDYDMFDYHWETDDRSCSIGGVEIQENDLDVIDYDSFGSDLDEGIDSQRRIQLRKLRRICKKKTRVPIKRVRVRCEGTIPALVLYVASDTDMGKNVFSQTKGGPVIREKSISGKQNILGKDKTYQGKGTIVRIDVQQEPNSDSPTRTFRRVYVCLESLKQGFRACGREILELDGCFMPGPFPGQILIAVRVDANNEIYSVAYAIVEAECKEKAIASVFPSYEHRYYVKHIHENMKSQFKGVVYKDMLWNATRATTIVEFKKNMA
ncbi:hypothetical protein Tco_1249354, partial [Tanacetum coccineum]